LEEGTVLSSRVDVSGFEILHDEAFDDDGELSSGFDGAAGIVSLTFEKRVS
jgi:hypothetical protein